MPEAIGSVTTSPIGEAAPVLGLPMLVVLAIALSVAAVYVAAAALTPCAAIRSTPAARAAVASSGGS